MQVQQSKRAEDIAVERAEERTNMHASKIAMLAELRLEMMELVPQGQSSIFESLDLNIHQARKFERAKESTAKVLAEEWLSLNSTERAQVARTIKEHTHDSQPRVILDGSGKTVGLNFSESGNRLTVQVNEEGKQATVKTYEKPVF